MAEEKTRRDDAAIIAHRDGLILVVRMKEYRDLSWRLVQGPMLPGLVKHEPLYGPEKAARMAVETRMVQEIFEKNVGTREIGAVRYGNCQSHFYYSEKDKEIVSPLLTANMHPSKTLHFYIAEIREGARLVPGPRVQSYLFLSPSELADRKVSEEECHGVENVLREYMI